MIESNPFFQPLGFAGSSPQAFVIILVLCFFAVQLWLAAKRKKRRRWQPKNRTKFYGSKPALVPDTSRPPNLSDPKVQMDAVAQAEFQTQRLLNKDEYLLLPLLESIVARIGNGRRVIIQTSLGEVITARSDSTEIQRRAYASINSKRLDFGIVDRTGILKLAIEYQGSGHYNDKTFMRDAVKREALRKAGVPMMEVRKDFSPDQITAEITSHLGAS